ncbi:MAG: hypothetical protein QXX38_01975 [Candidatus Aenigmatarchaeota archaeon]
MEDKISSEVEKKGYLLFKEGKIKKELETERRIHFKIFGKSNVHSVIFDKVKNEFNCDCKYSTLKFKECSHIFASKLFMKHKKN